MENQKTQEINNKWLGTSIMALKFGGGWRVATSSRLYYCYSLLIFLLYGVYFVLTAIRIYEVKDDANHVISIINVSLFHAGAFLKTISVMLARERMEALCVRLERNYHQMEQGKNLNDSPKISDDIIRKMRLFNVSMIISVGISGIIWGLTTMAYSSEKSGKADCKRHLPLDLYFPYNWCDSPAYEITSIYLTFDFAFSYYLNIVVDSFFFTLIAHTSGQLQALTTMLVDLKSHLLSSSPTMNFRSINDTVHDPVLTEISPLQLSLASNTWKLTEKVIIPNDVKLQSQESVHILAKACRHSKEAIETISDLPLSKITVIKEQSMSISPYHDFYQRHLRFSDVQNRLADTSGDLEAALRMGAMLILRWQSTINSNGNNGRTVIGQHHVAIDKLDVSATWPPVSSPALQMQEQQGPLYIFGPDVISSATSAMSDKYPSLDVLQRLVTYSIHHPPSIAHDFKHSRLCVVPVRLHLQNCSDSHLVIKVTTVGNSSSSFLTNKNQLYSPHSSDCFRWVGLACSNLELSPHASESVCLSAVFGSPGTFNLGTRLEVWCRSRGAPEADSVTQSWRVESSLIVCSTS